MAKYQTNIRVYIWRHHISGLLTQTLLMWGGLTISGGRTKYQIWRKVLTKPNFLNILEGVAPAALLILYFFKKTADQQIMTILSTFLQGLPYFSSPFFP